MRRDGRCAMRNVCFVHHELLHYEYSLFDPLHRRNKCYTTSTKRQKYVRTFKNLFIVIVAMLCPSLVLIASLLSWF